jgi:dihydrofolate reductase
MGKLIFMNVVSLDGYVADEEGKFDWTEPDEEVHSFFNDVLRPVGTYLFGRRLYEVMAVWETLPLEDQPPYMRDYAGIWRAADKVVYSRTLAAPSTDRTRIEREFDPEAVRELKAALDHDLVIGGPDLAQHAIRAGLVDEWHFTIAPVVVGGGTAALPDGIRVDLELVDERRFGNGMVFVRYRTRS